MKFLNGNIIYEFNVSQQGGYESLPFSTDDDDNDFAIHFRFRKFHAPSKNPMIELERSVRLARGVDSETQVIPLITDLLDEFDMSDQIQSDMALHFKFNLDRLSRRYCRCGVIPIAVTLDAKVISAEKAADIENRRNAAIERAVAPAKKAAME